jgi:hypothetical protein
LADQTSRTSCGQNQKHQKKEITKTSQIGTKRKKQELLIVNEDLLEKNEIIGLLDRILIKDIVNTA